MKITPRHIAVFVFLDLVVMAAALQFASPYLSMRGMHKAWIAKDAPEFSSYVDFPAVRTDFRDKIIREIAVHAKGSAEDTAKGALGMAVMEQILESTVSETGVRLLMEKPEAGAGAAEVSPSAEYHLRRTGWSTADLVVKRPGKEPLRIHLQQRALLRWVAVGFDQPA